MVKPSESRPFWFSLALFQEDAFQKAIQIVLQLHDSLTKPHPTIRKYIYTYYYKILAKIPGVAKEDMISLVVLIY